MANRHERRKRTKVLRGETVMLTPEDARRMLEQGQMCAWGDCGEHYTGKQPEGWRNLLVYGAPVPVLDFRQIPPETLDRDAVLCPRHVAELDGLLKDIGQRLKGPPAGTA